MTLRESRLGYLRFRAVSLTPFLPKSRPWSASGDAPNYDASRLSNHLRETGVAIDVGSVRIG
jgi:hypothetical protein